MIYYDGQVLSNASTYKDNAGVVTKEVRRLSGKLGVSSSQITTFKPSFTCYTEDYAEIVNLKQKIGLYLTLVIDGISHTNCTISSFEHIQYAPGKYKYEIDFSQDNVNTSSNQVYANEETVYIYHDYELPPSSELDSTAIITRGLAYVNISVENKGLSENLIVKVYGAHDLNGSIKYPMFFSVLDSSAEGNSSGGNISGPPNYTFVHIKNADANHSTTFDFVMSKVATL